MLCGKDAGGRARQLREAGFEGTLLLDPAAYEKEAATADEPFSLPVGQLFGRGLDDVLHEQLDCGASAALTPTRYIHPGDSAALKGLMRAAQAVKRQDTIVTVPVEITWLRDEFVRQLIAALKAIPHPKALIFGGQYDPFASFSKACVNLRRLVQEVPGVGLCRTELAAFDAIANGGLFASIGAGGSLRHVPPQGEKPQSSSRPQMPSVLVPDLMRFSLADSLARKYANVSPPRCSCPECDGGFLDSFNSRTRAVRAAAHAHNAATWNSWLPDLFGHASPGDRQVWWRKRCKAAVDAHELENVRIKQPNAFKPPKPLHAWATLPLPQDPPSE